MPRRCRKRAPHGGTASSPSPPTATSNSGSTASRSSCGAHRSSTSVSRADQWDTSLDRIKELGFNTIDLYVPWNWHELSDGEFDFDGHTNPRRDLRGLLLSSTREASRSSCGRGLSSATNGATAATRRGFFRVPNTICRNTRYWKAAIPSTATLQNAHSDDAAAEWMANATHMKYAARWLQTALHEFSAGSGRRHRDPARR